MKAEKEYSQMILGEELKILKVNTYGCLLLAFFCAYLGFDSAFPWLTAQVGLPWTAWGFSKTGYTMKSTKQNTAGGITYETAMLAAKAAQANPQTNSETEETVTDL
ncbi:MAG: hypothetical protein IJY52_05725 [Anaerotignum sp.]|nr:hypothetical protein [Anaerotignum sp.]